jgi:beta-glucanase (GH16 family)
MTKKRFITIITVSLIFCLEMNAQTTYNPGTDWNLIWSDEFEGDKLDKSKWNRQVEKAGKFNEEWQRYTKSKKNAYVENNQLVIKAIQKGEKHGHDQYTSARLNTAGKFTFKYGKVAARIKLPKTKGIWPAFWMLGANINENGGDTPWPQCGEIDILELYGSNDPSVVEANIHFSDKYGAHDQMGAKSFELEEGTFADQFRIFELEWTQEKVVWSIDGEEYASFSIKGKEFSMFHKEFFFLLNIAVGGIYAGRPDETSEFPEYMYVDWIRVYQKK